MTPATACSGKLKMLVDSWTNKLVISPLTCLLHITCQTIVTAALTANVQPKLLRCNVMLQNIVD